MKTLFFTILVILLFLTSCQESKRKKTAITKSTIEHLETPTAMSDHWQLIGEAVNEPGYDVWGSSPIRDDKGNVHLFCARWSSETLFKTAWRYNSEIAHYVAEGPEGPFEFVSVVGKGKNDGSWNSAGFHNPNIRKIDDKYVLVYIANNGDKNHGPSQQIGMLMSDNLNGAWQEIPNENTPLLSPPADSAIWCYNSGLGVNNPSIIKVPNGKYHLYFKAKAGSKGKVSMGVAIADKLEGPYIIQQNPITTNDTRVEDGYAFYWKNHICLLTTDNHGLLEKGGGLLWISVDGLTFNQEPLSGFHNCQDFYLDGTIPDGTNARYGNRVKFERPQLLMGANNEPEYLFCPSGLALDGSDGSNSYVLKYKE